LIHTLTATLVSILVAPGPGFTIRDYYLPMHERILANLRWKAGDSKRTRVSSTATTARVWELASDEEDE